MKQTVVVCNCDRCGRQVENDHELLKLELSGHRVMQSQREICWDCMYSFIEWRGDPLAKAANSQKE